MAAASVGSVSVTLNMLNSTTKFTLWASLLLIFRVRVRVCASPLKLTLWEFAIPRTESLPNVAATDCLMQPGSASTISHLQARLLGTQRLQMGNVLVFLTRRALLVYFSAVTIREYMQQTYFHVKQPNLNLRLVFAIIFPGKLEQSPLHESKGRHIITTRR
jgi:hypothetical protein